MPGHWYTIELGPAEITAGELEAIRAETARFFLLRELGDDAAVFTRRSRCGGCEIYFAPACAACAEFIFERHPPTRTAPPPLLGTTLLVGSLSAVGNLLGKLTSGGVRSKRPPYEPVAAVLQFLKSAADETSLHPVIGEPR
jgi:hypothetical protein